jgi:hypothetical protein
MRSQIAVRFAALVVAGLASTIATTSSLAQTSSPGVMVSAEPAATPAHHLLTDEWVVNVGAFVLATNLDASLNGTANTGANVNRDVNFDQAFGTDADATRVRADILWRFLPRHHLRFLYFDNDVTRTRTLDKDVVWGDYTFKAQGQATAQNKFTVYELAYEYAFMRDSNYEVVGSAGVHYMDLSLRISGNATVTLPDGTTSPTQSFESKTSSLPAPLPVLGLRGGWEVSPHWYLDASGQVFRVKIGAFDGNWWDLRANATWMYNRHFGIGAGWNKFTTHVDVSKTNFEGRLNVGYSGPLVFLTGSF